MSMHNVLTKGASIAIGDLLDTCAAIKEGQEVLILAQMDGLHGGDNLVDETAVSWIAGAVRQRGGQSVDPVDR